MSSTSELEQSQTSKSPSGAWSGVTRLSVLVFVLCFLINGIDGVSVTLISYLGTSVAREFSLSSTGLGLVFSALLTGMAAGGLLIAPLADRYGRRRLILAALGLLIAGMISSALAPNFLLFLAARVLVGLGIGPLLASMAALVSEFTPTRLRTLAVGGLQGGYPLGAAGTGFATVWALGGHGWRTILLAAGLLALLFVPLAAWLLPESGEFLAARPPDKPAGPQGGVRLLRPGLRGQTIPLWVAIFCGFAVLYAVMSWIPRLAVDAGLSTGSGLVAGAIYNLGAFTGTLTLSLLSTRFALRRLIIGFFLCAAALLVVFGSVTMPVWLVMAVIALIGVSLQGGFNGIYPLMAALYPMRMRGAGIGWAIGIGRAGAFLGPLMTGYILGLSAARALLLAILGGLLLLASAAVAAISRAHAEPA